MDMRWKATGRCRSVALVWISTMYIYSYNMIHERASGSSLLGSVGQRNIHHAHDFLLGDTPFRILIHLPDVLPGATCIFHWDEHTAAWCKLLDQLAWNFCSSSADMDDSVRAALGPALPAVATHEADRVGLQSIGEPICSKVLLALHNQLWDVVDSHDFSVGAGRSKHAVENGGEIA